MEHDVVRRYRWFRSRGYSARHALRPARAEQWKNREWLANRLRVRWEWDEHPYEPGAFGTEFPSEVLGCVVETRTDDDVDDCPHTDGDSCNCKHWRHADSLWGIGDPDRDYRRIIEAELCHEVMSTPVYEISPIPTVWGEV